jgi:hypothetical protein
MNRRPVCRHARPRHGSCGRALGRCSIDGDIKKLARASNACRRLMTIPGVGHLTALAFTAAVADPERFRRSRDLGAYLSLVPREPILSVSGEELLSITRC